MSEEKKKELWLPQNRAEWVSFIISLLLLAAVIAAIVALMVKEPQSPPKFRIELGQTRNEQGRYHMPVTVINEGGAPAAEVRVEGRLNANGQEERPLTTISFLPVHAREQIVLIFVNEPSSARIEVVSFQQP